MIGASAFAQSKNDLINMRATKRFENVMAKPATSDQLIVEIDLNQYKKQTFISPKFPVNIQIDTVVADLYRKKTFKVCEASPKE